MIDTIDEDELVVPIEEIHNIKALTSVIMDFDSNSINEYDEMVSALVGRGPHTYAPKK